MRTLVGAGAPRHRHDHRAVLWDVDGRLPFRKLCASAAVAGVGLEVTTDEAKVVQEISFRCRTIGPIVVDLDGQVEIKNENEGNFYNRPGAADFGCPPGEVGVGIVGRSGQFVDALGLVCAPPKLEVADPSTPPVPPAPPPPGVPLQRLKPPAPPATGVNFTGTWATTVPGGNRISIRMVQDVTGNATGVALPDNTHLFDGRVSGNRLIASWAGVYVQFTLAADGASFTGAWTKSGYAGGLASPDGTFNGYRTPANFPDGPTPGATTADDKKYSYPYITSAAGEAVLLDWCREWGVNCGKPAADAFCAAVDGGRTPDRHLVQGLPAGGAFQAVDDDRLKADL